MRNFHMPLEEFKHNTCKNKGPRGGLEPHRTANRHSHAARGTGGRPLKARLATLEDRSRVNFYGEVADREEDAGPPAGHPLPPD
jgi:hypothetical protein